MQVPLGYLCFNSGDLPQAEETYWQAFRVRPDNIDVFAMLLRHAIYWNSFVADGDVDW